MGDYAAGRVVILALLIIAYQALDLITFSWAASVVDIAGEANGLAVSLWSHYGLIAIVALKLLAVLGTWVIVAKVPRWRTTAVLLTALVAGTGALTNVAALAWR